VLRFYKIFYIAVPVLIILSAWLQVVLPCESDKGWLLHAAHMWLAGGKLYVTIIEINPPLIIWIYALPVWISMHLKGVADFEVLGVIGLLASAFTVWVGWRLIRRHPAFAGNQERQIKFVGLLALIFVFYTTQPYFFDREHIFLVLIFPYMLRFMPSLAEQTLSKRLRILIACMAAAGCCIKPHTLVVLGMLQIAAVVRKRSFRVLFNLENYIIAAAIFAYMISIWIFTPEYFTIILPMAFATYSKFGNAHSGYAFLPPFFIGIGLIFADFRPWHVTPYRRDVYYLAWICAAFLVYALINNGWGYTYNPLYCVLMLMSAWLIWEYDWLRHEYEARDLSTRQLLFGICGGALVLLVHAGYMLIYLLMMAANVDHIRSPCENNPDCWKQNTNVQYIKSHNVHTFGTISFDFSNWIILMRLSGTQWVTRFNHLWMVPMMMQSGEAFTASHYWILEFIGKGLAEDLNQRKPDIMIVDNSPAFMGWQHTFDLAGFISRIPEFKQAWSHYRYSTTFDYCRPRGNILPIACRYDVYSRIPDQN
jgi:hypothetical protein